MTFATEQGVIPVPIKEHQELATKASRSLKDFAQTEGMVVLPQSEHAELTEKLENRLRIWQVRRTSCCLRKHIMKTCWIRPINH